jgi:hypothetical protein
MREIRDAPAGPGFAPELFDTRAECIRRKSLARQGRSDNRFAFEDSVYTTCSKHEPSSGSRKPAAPVDPVIPVTGSGETGENSRTADEIGPVLSYAQDIPVRGSPPRRRSLPCPLAPRIEYR